MGHCYVRCCLGGASLEQGHAEFMFGLESAWLSRLSYEIQPSDGDRLWIVWIGSIANPTRWKKE